jgi:tRNA threonylcarbamoyladenosine biosynthesis protein TsaE
MNTLVLKIKTLSSQKTKNFAKLLAGEILARPPKISSALVLALTGDLGSGKTTFIQGFCKGAGIKKRITSPSFVLTKSYKLKTKSYKKIYHIDCYRIQKPKEILRLGFKEIINNPQNIVLIEWANRIKKVLSRNIVWISFGYGKKINQRSINVKFKNQKSKIKMTM